MKFYDICYEPTEVFLDEGVEVGRIIVATAYARQIADKFAYILEQLSDGGKVTVLESRSDSSLEEYGVLVDD